MEFCRDSPAIQIADPTITGGVIAGRACYCSSLSRPAHGTQHDSHGAKLNPDRTVAAAIKLKAVTSEIWI
jgi:hypothetical protein